MVTMVARPVVEALLGAQSRTSPVYIVDSAIGSDVIPLTMAWHGMAWGEEEEE